jgi:aspartyl protease family protein
MTLDSRVLTAVPRSSSLSCRTSSFLCLALAIPLLLWAQLSRAGYLDEDPDDVFADVYLNLLTDIPAAAARDPYIWLRLQELKRERCDQTSVNDLALALDKLGYRREAANALFRFVQHCGAPISALTKSMDIFLRLSDFPKVIEVADEYIKREPQASHPRYMRGVGLQGIGEFERALTDYSDSIELFGQDKIRISSSVFVRMAVAYAALGRLCEASTPILTWMAYDPVTRDNSQTQKIIADYDQRGNCVAVKNTGHEHIPTRGRGDVVIVKVEINGIRGNFLLDTGATYVSLKSSFAEKAKISTENAPQITLSTANGLTKGKLTTADKVTLRTLQAAKVPTVVQNVDDKSYGANIDGLLGMSFLSRFQVQLTTSFVDISARGRPGANRPQK